MSILGLSPPPTRRQEFAEFLRQRREATRPEAAGFSVNGNRRTPGLRREEVSQLAGVGLSWYTWLEQGREITPSAGVLDALARVYDLDAPERAHLFDLAGVPLAAPAGPYPTQAPAELLAVVNGIEPNAAYLLGPRMDILAWNRGCQRMFGTVPPGPDGTPNLMWWLFTRPRPDDEDWSTTGRNTVARFRAEHARRYDDPGFARLISALLEESVGFRELWRRHEVQNSQLGTKDVDHPEMGPLHLYHLQSIPTSHPDLRLVQYIPADEATRVAFANA